MGNFVTLGVIVVIIGLSLMIKGNRSRGGMGGSYGRAKGTVVGPVWFLLIVLGVFLIALDPFIPV